MSQPLTDWKMAPWPVPHGWAYVWEDMHSIERAVGNYKLCIGQDDGEWRWWLCPNDSGLSIARGEGHDLLDAIWRAFDALATQLDNQIHLDICVECGAQGDHMDISVYKDRLLCRDCEADAKDAN